VNHRDPQKLHAEDARAINEGMDLNARPVGVRGMRRKRVVVDSAKNLLGFLACVEGDIPAFPIYAEAQGTKVVETEDVVDVPMGIKNGIDAREFAAKSLLPKIRPGIDEYHAVSPVMTPLEQDGGTQATIAGIGRCTHGTRAAQRGNSHGSSGSEKCEPAFHGP
jgi:hypothetical protein